jgi:uncharacterized protein (DUF4415 family)
LIQAGIAADTATHELDSSWHKTAKPASEALPAGMYANLVAQRSRGRPKSDQTKVFTAIRLDADLLNAFKSTGKGWQTRVNAALRQYIQEHPLTP